IEVKDKFVILSGLVGSEYRKQLAEAVAKSVPGVRGVENQLRINHLAQRSDKEIQTDVESRIRWDPRLESPQIQVQVRNRTVILAGVVESSRAKAQAYKDAQVAGVKAVDASGLRVLEEQKLGEGGSSLGGASLPGD
ncbi:MAG TPA: BON domain-containing protein, partial [Clostridia bacterium]|nr:BON domain-containing protein [Clostridia bacterium]